MIDLVGRQIGNYRLTRRLGSGNFADVYLGEHLHLDTHQAAIKVLRAQLAREDMEKFRAEARVLAHLAHPGIVRLLDYHIEGSTPFVVMEYAPNGTLRQRYPKGTRLPFDTIVSYVTQIADALQHAHHEKLVHRDVKPGNILLGRHHEALLADFGLAVLTRSVRSQSLEKAAGTPAYMAPEQLRGGPRRASDQYSLGIMVYEWLSGDVPFHGSFIQVASHHLFTPPPPLSEKVFMPPLTIEPIVRRALAKDPKDRFASVQEFAQALAYASQQAIQLASDPTLKDETPSQARVLQQVKAFPPQGPSPVLLKAKEQWFLKGSTHHNAKQYQEAIAAYSFVIELDPAYAWAYGRRGQAYAALNEYRRAIKVFDQALELDPRLSWVRTAREYAYQQLRMKMTDLR